MTDSNLTPEGRAWRKLQEPAPRGVYQHARVHARREAKREMFRSYLVREVDGCWLWVGPTRSGVDGTPFAYFYHWKSTTPDNTTTTAFNWMMREWFPSTKLKMWQRTNTSCGRSLCLSPFHRRNYVTRGTSSVPIETVRAIYDAKGTATQQTTADKFGVHVDTVRRIWRGERWRQITGALYDPHPKYLPDNVVRGIYAERTSGRTRRGVAEQFGVSTTSVRSIWMGLTRAEITGAVPAVGTKRPRLSEETKREILSRRGESSRAVAQDLGVSRGAIHYVWKKADLSG